MAIGKIWVLFVSYLRDNSAFPINLRKLCVTQKAETMPPVCDQSSFSVSSRTLTFSQKAKILAQGGKTATTLRKTISLFNISSNMR